MLMSTPASTATRKAPVVIECATTRRPCSCAASTIAFTVFRSMPAGGAASVTIFT